MIRRVIKFGGSLFEVHGIAELCHGWLQRQKPAVNIVIAGGGGLVDAIRSRQSESGLDDADCHWLSIDAMSRNSQFVHQLIADSMLTSDIGDLKHCEKGIVVFDSAIWLRTGNQLPESWDVTSDSIAAGLAQSLIADELVLWKSALPPREVINIIELAGMGFVDRHFPMVATGLQKIRIVNLRSIHAEIELVAVGCSGYIMNVPCQPRITEPDQSSADDNHPTTHTPGTAAIPRCFR